MCRKSSTPTYRMRKTLNENIGGEVIFEYFFFLPLATAWRGRIDCQNFDFDIRRQGSPAAQRTTSCMSQGEARGHGAPPNPVLLQYLATQLRCSYQINHRGVGMCGGWTSPSVLFIFLERKCDQRAGAGVGALSVPWLRRPSFSCHATCILRD